MGVMNICNDSDEDEEYFGDQKEVQAEMDELNAAASWVNPKHWDAAQEAYARNRNDKDVDLRYPKDFHGNSMSWDAVQKALAGDIQDDAQKSSTTTSDQKIYILEDLDPTQRAFADRVLKWGAELCNRYQSMETDGKPRDVPLLRTWLCGSAGSGKSTTLKAIV